MPDLPPTQPGSLKPLIDATSVDMLCDSRLEFVRATTGPRTSEFWTSIITHIAGLTLVTVGAIRFNMEMIYVGGGMMSVTQATYNIARGLAKRS